MKRFEMTHKFFPSKVPEQFSEEDAPSWLTGADTVPGSTMDNRWFWSGYILPLAVGETAETDFRTIKRIE